MLGAGDVFAGYSIVRQLGRGGMGEVYLARHPRLPRQDALKVLRSDISTDNDFRRRFIREADLAAALTDPHIVTVYDRGDYNGQLWIATQFHLYRLRTRLRRTGPHRGASALSAHRPGPNTPSPAAEVAARTYGVEADGCACGVEAASSACRVEAASSACQVGAASSACQGRSRRPNL